MLGMYDLFSRPAFGSSRTESSLSAQENSNYNDAIRKLLKQVIKTAVMIGKSSLNGMDRSVAEAKLQMVLDRSVTPASRSPADKMEALKWFNWMVELLNGVRRTIGCPSLMIQSGFHIPLAEGGVNGW